MPDPADVAAALGGGPRSGKSAGRCLRTGRARQLVADRGVHQGDWRHAQDRRVLLAVERPVRHVIREAARDHGAYVLVQLQPGGVSLASIAAGGSDAYLRSYAGAVVAFGHPVILSFGHEMNGTWYSWGDGHTSPAAFVAAWRHVVRVFRAAGAASVTWLWTVNSIVPRGGELAEPVVAGRGVGRLDRCRRLLLPGHG